MPDKNSHEQGSAVIDLGYLDEIPKLELEPKIEKFLRQAVKQSAEKGWKFQSITEVVDWMVDAAAPTLEALIRVGDERQVYGWKGGYDEMLKRILSVIKDEQQSLNARLKAISDIGPLYLIVIGAFQNFLAEVSGMAGEIAQQRAEEKADRDRAVRERRSAIHAVVHPDDE